MAKQKISIEDLLVWAYKDQAVDEYPNDIGGPALSAMSWNVPIDGSGTLDQPPGDAFLIHSEVCKLSRICRQLVIGSAKTEMPPDWYDGARLMMVAVVNNRGNPACIKDESRNVIGHKVTCAVELSDFTVMVGWGMETIMEARKLYSAWRESLVALKSGLQDRLEEFDPVGPHIEVNPWDRVKAA